MTEEQVELGKSYTCKPVGFIQMVTGEVVSKMKNCAIIKVSQCAAADLEMLDEKASMVVAKYETFE
ncbi:MAG: hypothetical protein ACK5NA_08820 [Enterococcus sp.]